MAIGRFRDAPAEMDAAEQRVAAAQYPEGGLVAGTFAGVVVGALTLQSMLVVGPVAGGLVGFFLGRRYRASKLTALRADQAADHDGTDAV